MNNYLTESLDKFVRFMKHCKKHSEVELKLLPNSTLHKGCWKCASEKRIAKNKELLAQSHIKTSSMSKNVLKSKKGKTKKQKAKDRADEWFSRYIRLKYAFYSNGEWYCQCYTCGNPKLITEIQNGHWRRREFNTTRFHENDARPQCVKCNYHRSGEPEKFEAKLIAEIGANEVENIRMLSLEIGEDNEIFFREISDKYRILVNKLLKEKSIKKWW